MNKVPHPIPYQGSKRKLAQMIFSTLPKNGKILYEPFAGSAAMTLFCASNNYGNEYVIGDSLKPLVELLKIIVKKTNVIAVSNNINVCPTLLIASIAPKSTENEFAILDKRASLFFNSIFVHLKFDEKGIANKYAKQRMLKDIANIRFKKRLLILIRLKFPLSMSLVQV